MKNKINKNSKVILDYEIISEGDVCDKKSSFGLEMIDETLIKPIMDGLLGLEEGEDVTIQVNKNNSGLEESEDAYLRLSRDSFLEDVVLGDYYRAEGMDGNDIGIKVIEIEGDDVVGSGNHPLINKDFIVNLHVVGVANLD